MFELHSWLQTLRDELSESVGRFLEFLALGVATVLLTALSAVALMIGLRDDWSCHGDGKW